VVQEEDRTSIIPGPSVHRAVSLKAGSHASSLRSASGTPAPFEIPLNREELLAALDIPAHLTERDKRRGRMMKRRASQPLTNQPTKPHPKVRMGLILSCIG